MKTVFYITGIILILCAALATPAGIVHGVYEWVGNDLEFKYALWEGVKLWLIMLSAAIVAYPLFVISATK
tara:strand:+ start:3972 stop:4181 length:210 start_codon:yes stop_codon:yes gene_type:complete